MRGYSILTGTQSASQDVEMVAQIAADIFKGRLPVPFGRDPAPIFMAQNDGAALNGASIVGLMGGPLLDVHTVDDLLSIAGGGEDDVLVGARLCLSENKIRTYSRCNPPRTGQIAPCPLYGARS